ncbi:MAG: hypothetical protein HLUCCA11_14125 [Phormidesmis priestleyi Ana]|uniref:SPOR domain-containing protein n=1 Tax=Phormidesmis priestleyi Ana TaxID=1666911 RepID=A0A0P8BLQ4_9CYAN|nr:MAG: hypothetical protein HLUCCA11_14125 [Phormidesmis priestleyi Ana]
MTFSRRLPPLARLLSIGLSALLLPLLPDPAHAQLPNCPPPIDQEYLLLIRGATEAERNQIASVLPAANTVLICTYLNETLVRAGGFTSLETANAWATYLTTVEGYESFVSRPSGNQVATQTGNGTAASGDHRYQPQRLAAGYAVLVNYGAQPEIATMVGQLVRPVGLAVYRQQAYLLAEYTSDAAAAAATLERLSDAQLTAILVDARQVVQLTAEVAR